MNSKVKAEEHIYEHGKQENIKGKDGKSKRGWRTKTPSSKKTKHEDGLPDTQVLKASEKRPIMCNSSIVLY